MRKLFALSLPALGVLLLSNPAAKADTLDFTLTGQGQTLTFSLPSSPTSFSSTSSTGFVVAGVSDVLNGTPGVTEVGFYNALAQFFFGPNAAVLPGEDGTGGAPQDFFSGDALFSGPSTAPVFKTGTFNERGDSGDSLPSGAYTMTISDVPSAAPEPSSLVLLGTGALGLAASFRRRLMTN